MSNFKSTLIAYDEWLPDGLFKKLTLPEGINKKTLTNVIMLECGEMCPVWTNPNFMQEMIGVWSNKWQSTFKRWITALNTSYDPLNNYDRYESYTESNRGKTSNKLDGTDRTISDRSIDTTTSGTDTDKKTGTEQTAKTGTETDKKTGTETDKVTGTDTTVTDHDVTSTTSGTTTNSRSAFDQTGFSDHDKSVTSGNDTTADDSTVTLTHNTTDTLTHNTTDTLTHDTTETLTHNTTDTLTRSGSESVDDDATINRTLSNTENGTDEHERTYTAHMYGNIGVVSSQQMLEQEYNIALWNIYEHIKDLFMQEFCIMVY